MVELFKYLGITAAVAFALWGAFVYLTKTVIGEWLMRERESIQNQFAIGLQAMQNQFDERMGALDHERRLVEQKEGTAYSRFVQDQGLAMKEIFGNLASMNVHYQMLVGVASWDDEKATKLHWSEFARHGRQAFESFERNRIFFSPETCARIDQLYAVFIQSTDVLGEVFVHANMPHVRQKLITALGAAEGHFVTVLKEAVRGIETEFRELMKAPEK
jgi:hypothetical protein